MLTKYYRGRVPGILGGVDTYAKHQYYDLSSIITKQCRIISKVADYVLRGTLNSITVSLAIPVQHSPILTVVWSHMVSAVVGAGANPRICLVTEATGCKQLA